MEKITLAGKNLQELEAFMIDKGQSKFRAKQLYNWIYLKSVKDIDSMTDLSISVREMLKKETQMSSISIKDKQVSHDGTMKYLFELSDGNFTEAVLMRFDNRANLTACISTQVGCPMGCSFCATAKLGFKRNLQVDEIIQQIYLIQADTGLKVTNIVYMGQGEPLLNMENLLASIKIFREQFQIGARRITVSTCGIIPGINKLAEMDFQSTLAISLHAPNQQVRKDIMPVAKKYEYDELIKSLKQYTEMTGRRITIEYVLIKGINDSVENAKELAKNIIKLKSNVNLIVYNENEKSPYKKPTGDTIQKFKYILEAAGKKVTIRLERGADIDAACGQLSAKFSAKD
ncbi:MAG: 23S rRNA (adenine(2503)-C(2))-methyltransferase RlmN [Candidatus Gastranaerophilales bacterium]|nr:23S rRNA (adenine(2503)-C(2))-methyltransferase RlmN [Candidatus Gastranaerophilales bacterium]